MLEILGRGNVPWRGLVLACEAIFVVPQRRRISDTLPKVEADDEEEKHYPLDADITFLQPAGLTGVALEASRTGMRVVVDSPLELGQRCVAVVQLPTGEELHERAEVVALRRGPNGWVADLVFAQ
jgi:hypothetical protein